MLGVVVFVAGAVLMALEMVGSRLLAPYFGNSIYVWGSLISVVLAALTAGYFVGGRLADRRPQAQWLGWLIAVPGVFVTSMPLWAGPLNHWLVSSGTSIREGSLVSALLLFFLPGLFLGTVSPYAIRLAAQGVETIGLTAGTLYAVSTAGSIAGTLLTSFYLVAWLGVTQILYVLGVVLVLLGLAVVGWGHAGAAQPAGPVTPSPAPSPRAGGGKPGSGRTPASSGRPRSPTVSGAPGGRGGGRTLLVGAVLALAATGASVGAGVGRPEWTGLAQERGAIVYQKDSAYHHILVVDDPVGLRYLKFDDSWQSAMDKADPKGLVFGYTRYFHLAMALAPQAREALMVGLGGGSVPKNFLAFYPSLRMDVAELDPEVVRVAHRFFAVPLDDRRLAVHAQDGRIFVERTRARYDAVFLDAYFAYSIPFHLATREFYEALKSRLQPGGVVASNIIGALSGRHSLLFRSMLRTMQAVFPTTYVLPVGATSGSAIDPAYRNIIVLATDQQAMAPGEFQARVERLEQEGRLPPGTSSLARSLVVEPIDTHDVPLLTDDHAPVDTLVRI
ncbi:MAG: fused MFS/spermidine synthase [Limnochordaceae bacterium]|nr:fused MFS/spermidine synthase [Limnochordaceae bacterium]